VRPTTSRTPPIVTCDGTGVVSHAGTVLLAKLADRIGLTAALNLEVGGHVSGERTHRDVSGHRRATSSSAARSTFSGNVR